MKNALTIGVVGAALAATLTFVTAGSFKREQVTAADALPANAIVITVRAMGLNPIGDPVRRGPYYVLHAYDPSGIEVRVVADAHFGDILSVAPARALFTVFAPIYERRPRIIHVPQPAQRFKTNTDNGEKFDPPRDPAVTSSAPPAGYSPPATHPQND